MKQRLLIVAILVLASAQCARSIFFQNVSFISLEKYGQGTELLPFQGRALMMPVMRWAHSNPRLIAAAARSNEHQLAAEPQTPEKLISSAMGILWIAGLGALATFEALRRGFRYWWLPWALVLEILFTTYASRATQNFWYPYDLPQFFLFGLGTVFVLRGWWLPLLLLMPVVSANRETAIFLALLWLVAAWKPERKTIVVLQTAALGAAWLAVQLYIRHLFRDNGSVTGNRMLGNIGAFRQPLSWPQIASAFGFMLPFLLIYNRRLSERSRQLLFAMLPCLAVIVWYGYVIESRVFGEFTLLFAMLATEAWENQTLIGGTKQDNFAVGVGTSH